MCRFFAYLGEAPLVLSKGFESPKAGLIAQSHTNRGALCVNGDGLGIAWYDHSIDEFPGVYKSTQPAWNDANLLAVTRKIKSQCMLGHIRAASMGDINLHNSHPFVHKQWSFLHNGSMRQFEKFRRPLTAQLKDEAFHAIKGNTDSEHFFALLLHYLPEKEQYVLDDMTNAFQLALADVNQWQAALSGPEVISKLNIALTDGHSLLATRYVTDITQNAFGLFYTSIETIAESLDLRLNKQKSKGVLVASEPLDGVEANWHAVPVNHFLRVEPDYSVTLQSIT